VHIHAHATGKPSGITVMHREIDDAPGPIENRAGPAFSLVRPMEAAGGIEPPYGALQAPECST
jgi:hypothetical protein